MIALKQLESLELMPKLYADAEVSLSDLKPDLLNELDLLQPTGRGNPPALFLSRDIQVKRSWFVGKDKSHLKLIVTDGNITFDAIAFRLGQMNEHLQDNIDIIYTFEINEYNNRVSLQINVKDIKPSLSSRSLNP